MLTGYTGDAAYTIIQIIFQDTTLDKAGFLFYFSSSVKVTQTFSNIWGNLLLEGVRWCVIAGRSRKSVPTHGGCAVPGSTAHCVYYTTSYPVHPSLLQRSNWTISAETQLTCMFCLYIIYSLMSRCFLPFAPVDFCPAIATSAFIFNCTSDSEHRRHLVKLPVHDVSAGRATVESHHVCSEKFKFQSRVRHSSDKETQWRVWAAGWTDYRLLLADLCRLSTKSYVVIKLQITSITKQKESKYLDSKETNVEE